LFRSLLKASQHSRIERDFRALSLLFFSFFKAPLLPYLPELSGRVLGFLSPHRIKFPTPLRPRLVSDDLNSYGDTPALCKFPGFSPKGSSPSARSDLREFSETCRSFLTFLAFRDARGKLDVLVMEMMGLLKKDGLEILVA